MNLDIADENCANFGHQQLGSNNSRLKSDGLSGFCRYLEHYYVSLSHFRSLFSVYRSGFQQAATMEALLEAIYL